MKHAICWPPWSFRRGSVCGYTWGAMSRAWIFGGCLVGATIPSCCAYQRATVRTIDEVQRRPVLLANPDPDTSACTGYGIRVAEVALVISASGVPRHLRLTRSSGNTCVDKSVLHAASAYRFRAAQDHGHPVAVSLSMDVSINPY